MTTTGMLAPLVPAGAGADETYDLVVTPERAGWAFSGLRILPVSAAAPHTFQTGPDEVIVLPLSGGATVSCEGSTFQLVAEVSALETTQLAHKNYNAHTAAQRPFL